MMESLYYTQRIEKADPTNVTVDKFMVQLDRGELSYIQSASNQIYFQL